LSLQQGSVNDQNVTMDKIVLVVLGNCDFDPNRFQAKITIFDFGSNIVTTLDLTKKINSVWYCQ